MRNSFIILLLFFATITFGQDYRAVDARVRQYPKTVASAEALATQIQKDFKNDKERVRAVYTWLALNVSYDMDEFLNGDRFIRFSYSNQADLQQKQKALKEHSIISTLRTNSAICEGYAQTFKKVCDLMNIPCLFVDGYSKTGVRDIGKNPPRPDHAWNAVKIDNKWYVLDVTWGAGRGNGNTWKASFSDYYFFTDPNEFVKTHLPSVEGLSFAKNEPTKREFFEEPIYSLSYFESGIKLRTPSKGTLKVKSGNAIKFEIEKTKDDVRLHYATRANMQPKAIDLTCVNTKCTFQIPLNVTSNTTLFIIANLESAIQYKIEVQ